MNHRRKLLDLVKSAASQSIQNSQIKPALVKKFAVSFAKLPRAQALFCLNEYHRILQRQTDASTLKIETATPLSTVQVSSIKKSLSSDHQILTTEVINNPSLLGGVRVRIGDDVYEDSIQSRIEHLKGAILG